MKLLTDCAKGTKARINKINASGPLKQRLISLGIMKNAEITVLAQTAAKSTMEIKVNKMQLALRKEEAQLIEVEVI